MSGERLALEASDESDWEWQKYRERTTVTGPWPAFERAVTEAIIRSAWGNDSSPFWPASSGRPDEIDVIDGLHGRRWARMRVTVEVLDGVP